MTQTGSGPDVVMTRTSWPQSLGTSPSIWGRNVTWAQLQSHWHEASTSLSAVVKQDPRDKIEERTYHHIIVGP